MRIAGKHLRYTMEIFAPIYEGSLDPFVILMKNLQTILGEIHDNDVWINWLPKFIEKEQQRVEDYFGSTGPLVRLLPGLNHLIEDRQQAREKAYQTFLLAWQALKTVIRVPLKVEEAVQEQAEEQDSDLAEDLPSPDQFPIE
jgi:CHAD domain-containing protein